MIAAAQEKARELKIRVTVAIVDEGAHLQALARMDSAFPLSAQIAEAKATGAALLHRDGASIAQVHEQRPGFFHAADRLARLPLVPGLGSLVVRRGEAVLGAVGVSGGKPEEDLACAQHGLAALETSRG